MTVLSRPLGHTDTAMGTEAPVLCLHPFRSPTAGPFADCEPCVIAAAASDDSPITTSLFLFFPASAAVSQYNVPLWCSGSGKEKLFNFFFFVKLGLS